MSTDINLILAEYAAARESGADIRLAGWIARYPDHAEELRRFALYSDVMAVREPLVADDPAAEGRFVERAARVAERLRAEGIVAQPKPLTSLVKAAMQQKLLPNELAERLGLAVSFVARLDQRLFVPSSVPRALIERLASTLNRTAQEVAAYLTLPPRTALAADYRASEAPAVAGQCDFRETVQAALDLTDEQKREWLEEGALGH